MCRLGSAELLPRNSFPHTIPLRMGHRETPVHDMEDGEKGAAAIVSLPTWSLVHRAVPHEAAVSVAPANPRLP